MTPAMTRAITRAMTPAMTPVMTRAPLAPALAGALGAIACAVTVGCGAPTPALPSNAIAQGPSAERAFRDSLAPDHHASPADGTTIAARKRAGELFASDCRAGVAEACWWARALLDDDRFDEHVAANCASGHALSCRAAKRQPDLSEKQLHEGCASGVVAECVHLAQTTESAEETRFAWERACSITPTTCRDAAEAFLELEPPDLVKARDMLELACSAGRAGDCVVLGAAYMRGELVEPVPGRGRVVYEFACSGNPQRAGKACADGTSTPLLRPKIDI